MARLSLSIKDILDFSLFKILAALLVPAISWSCGQSSAPRDAQGANDSVKVMDSEPSVAKQQTGEQVYNEKVRDANTFTCSTCHGVSEEDTEGFVGHSLRDAAKRPSYKNGQIDTLLGAVNNCLTEWMAAEPFTIEDQRFVALESWLNTLAPEEIAKPVAIKIINPPKVLTGGDELRGQTTFNRTCGRCHGLSGMGGEKGPGLKGFGLKGEFIADKVRKSGPRSSEVYGPLAGGRMPFWGEGRLADSELLDILAFMTTEAFQTQSTPENVGEGQKTVDLSRADSQSSCGSDHPKVGTKKLLSKRAHGVSGELLIKDNCTFEIRDFKYDGGGIDVRFYGAKGGNFDQGSAISTDIFGRSFKGESVTIRIPKGQDLNSIDSLSVWCVAVGVDFGSARW